MDETQNRGRKYSKKQEKWKQTRGMWNVEQEAIYDDNQIKPSNLSRKGGGAICVMK